MSARVCGAFSQVMQSRAAQLDEHDVGALGLAAQRLQERRPAARAHGHRGHGANLRPRRTDRRRCARFGRHGLPHGTLAARLRRPELSPAAGPARPAARRARAGPGRRGRRRTRARSGSSPRPELAAGDDARARVERRQRAEHLDDAVDHARRRGRERHHVGLLGLDQRGRCPAPARPGPSSSTSQPSASRKSATIRSADRVQLLGRPVTTASRPSFGARVSCRREAVEDRLGDRGRVVLLGDVERAHRPAVPDLAQRGLEHLEVDVRDRDARPPARPRPQRRARAESRASRRRQERFAVLVHAHRP